MENKDMYRAPGLFRKQYLKLLLSSIYLMSMAFLTLIQKFHG
jgi:hypothetical protein